MKRITLSLLISVFFLTIASAASAQYYRGGYGCSYGRSAYGQSGYNSSFFFPGGFSVCNPSPSDAWSLPYTFLFYLREFRGAVASPNIPQRHPYYASPPNHVPSYRAYESYSPYGP